MLGAGGNYTLTETMRVGAGVTFQGAGAGGTMLDACRPAGRRQLRQRRQGNSSGLDGLTIHGADTCVQWPAA